ncbi:glycosylase [Microbacteriaceae bacterium VKM Ac-2855]|nr:glycosylase [Microbacteriaceae bacterium VKM Ac-2855]
MVERVMAIAPDEVATAVAELAREFTHRDTAWASRMRENAAAVGARLDATLVDADRAVLLGAVFTAEFALEGAALCNPSAMPHPDQSRLGPGQTRVALSLRQIGEGHRSSLGFATAIIGPGRAWRFEPRAHPPAAAEITAGRWTRGHFRAALNRNRPLSEVSVAVLDALPEEFGSDHLEAAIALLPARLAERYDAALDLAALRLTATSAYTASFAADIALARRTLLPAAPEEAHGVEDARFTLVEEGAEREYLATYTAYDGHAIASRMLSSRDLQTFTAHRLTGPPASNKGMAFFPRRVGGERLALTRTDGDTLSLARSADGLHWEDFAAIEEPRALWQTVQQGNCGPPIETERGWLVLTHGVGPMRRYSLGAILLDLERPERVLASLAEPLLRAHAAERNGYVPNVVYSCGGIVVQGVLWIPYGISDARIGVASVGVDELLDAMTPALP